VAFLPQVEFLAVPGWNPEFNFGNLWGSCGFPTSGSYLRLSSSPYQAEIRNSISGTYEGVVAFLPQVEFLAVPGWNPEFNFGNLWGSCGFPTSGWGPSRSWLNFGSPVPGASGRIVVLRTQIEFLAVAGWNSELQLLEFLEELHFSSLRFSLWP